MDINPYSVNTGLRPFPYIMTPLNNITPFTYRNGTQMLEILVKFEHYLTETLVPEFDKTINDAFKDFQAGLTNAENTIIANKEEWQASFDAFMADISNTLQGLNDQAMSDLIKNPTSKTSIELAKIYAKITSVNTAIAAVELRTTAIETILNTGRLSTTEINKLATKAALATTDSAVASHTTTLATLSASQVDTGNKVTELQRLYTVKPIDIVFIGDSYFTGYQPLPTPWIKSVPTIVTERLNARGLNQYVAHNYSGNAGGYDSSIGGGDTTFQTQVNTAIADATISNCKLIVFGGGRNDSNSGKDVKSKAKAMYKQMRAKFPQAKIIVVPFWDYTRFNTGQRKTFMSIFDAAKEEGCVYDVNSLWLAGLTKADAWIDSIPHPLIGVAEIMASGIMSLNDGGSLPGLSGEYYVRPSSGFTGGIATLEGMTCSVTMKNDIGANFGNSYIIGTLDPIFRPAGNQYIQGYSGNGATTNLYQIVGSTGDIGLQAFSGGIAGLSGLTTSYPLGSI